MPDPLLDIRNSLAGVSFNPSRADVKRAIRSASILKDDRAVFSIPGSKLECWPGPNDDSEGD